MSVREAIDNGRPGAGDRRDLSGDDMLTIVDAHHHLWDLTALHYPWLDDAIVKDFMFGDYSRLRRNYGAADYRDDASNWRIVATVHCEAEADRSDPLAETRWISDQHHRHGLPNAIVAWADFGSPDLARLLDEHLAFSLVRGIRCKPRLPVLQSGRAIDDSGDFGNPVWLDGLALCQRRGLSWDLRVPWPYLEAAAQVAVRHDGGPIILNHCGLPWDRSADAMATWRRGMQALGKLPHVSVKLSELGLRDEGWSLARNLPVLREVLEIFGPRRCLFASNFPVAGLRVDFSTWVRAVATALESFSADERADVFRRNAAAIYRIDFDVDRAVQAQRPAPPVDVAVERPENQA
jgi:predicted TIM-barrel fold metal-dependent hydrolase